jgi:hypothetical protein
MVETRKPSVGTIVIIVGRKLNDSDECAQHPAIILEVLKASNKNGEIVSTWDIRAEIFGDRLENRSSEFPYDPSGETFGSWHFLEKQN